MSSIETIFNNPDKAMAILVHMSKSHEIAVETITEIHKVVLMAVDIVNEQRNFLEKINELNIPQEMLDNVQNAIEVREQFANFLLSGNAERINYDKYMMNIYSFVLEACSIGQRFAALMGNSNDQFNVRDHILNFDTIFKEIYDMFHELAEQSREQIKEYANL